MKCLVLFLVFVPLGTFAQGERLGTDRPDQTEATMTVPMGSLQVETGVVLFPHTDGRPDHSAPQVLVRLGLGERVEFRAEGERTVIATAEGGKYTAWEVPELGAKVGMGDGGKTGIRTAMLVKLGIPHWSTANDGDPYAGLRMAADRNFGERFGLGANVAMEWEGVSTSPTSLYTLSGGMEVSSRFAAFAELYGALPEGGTGDHRWDCGGTWALGPNMLADASLGNCFTGQEWFFSAGFSFRVQCWRKKVSTQ